MHGALRILHLEDNPMDAELIADILQQEAPGCEVVCVQSHGEFLKALEASAYDLILSDYSGPDFDGASSLRLCRERHPDTPFIFVSGSIGEEAAIDSLFGGATDYVLKERLKRLGPAVARALMEAKGRRERKLLEQKFLQAQKMEVVGQLAGGLAHDFNNLLAVILGHVELLLERNYADGKVKDSLRDIHRAAESAGGLTRQLLLISRKHVLQTKSLDLNDVIQVMAKMLGRVIGKQIELRVESGKNRMWVKADSSMVEQVIMNLVVNARDAMPKGGRITLASERVVLDHAPGGVEGRRPGRFICLSVADTGMGIPPEVMSRLFDPFFTTKEAGKGTGLGLSTVYGIVRQHAGWIEVHSQPGRGSEFRIYLPESEERDPAQGAEPALPGPAGKETVLVVEENARLRKEVRIYLEEQGYVILEAAQGAEAMEVSRYYQGRIDLLIADLMLSDDMTGRDLAQKLREKDPAMQAIYTTAYGLTPLGAEGGPAASGPFLPKPYERAVLLRIIRQCLDSKSPSLSQS